MLESFFLAWLLVPAIQFTSMLVRLEALLLTES
jgi:hypothetical protein